MRAVLISIQPKWCEAIAAGEKTIEVRKSAPKEVPFKVYIYETKESKRRYLDDRFNSFFSNKSHYTDMGKVIGEFVCDKVYNYFADDFVGSYDSDGNIITEPREGEFAYWVFNREETCIPYNEILKYGKGKTLYGWHISDLKIYGSPKELSNYIRECRQPAEIQCENCHYFAWNDDHFCTDKRRTITRPPQSWCYVDELEVG